MIWDVIQFHKQDTYYIVRNINSRKKFLLGQYYLFNIDLTNSNFKHMEF